MGDLFACPWCGHLALPEPPPGTFAICPVCFWEDDNVQFADPTYSGGANRESFLEARENFARMGATSEGARGLVRPARPGEVPESPLTDTPRILDGAGGPALDRSRLVKSFPLALRDEVERVTSPIADSGLALSKGGDSFVVNGEQLWMPNRMYYDRIESGSQLTSTEQATLAAIYTRHNNGRVRQESLRSLLDNESEWVVPFIIRLLGEYVVPIHRDIADHARAGGFNRDTWTQFAAANPGFMARTRKRVVSYLNEYGYEWMLALGQGSPLAARDALEHMGLWPATEGRRMITRARRWSTPPGWSRPP